MDILNNLTELFRKFPGIGPRQAGRFTHFLLERPEEARELRARPRRLPTAAHRCADCRRFFVKERAQTVCRMCRDETRTKELLMVVARDADLDAMEKSSYRGYYFVLGGTIPLTVGPGEKIPGLAVLQKRAAAIAAEGGREVILAFPANPEGEHTAEMTAAALAPVAEKYQLTVTRLGRGLSTGTELEYADADTLASAFRNRQS